MAGTSLLVEDEPSVGELVRGYLTRDGYRVVWVRSGEDALVELDRHPVRMVLLDIGLPGKEFDLLAYFVANPGAVLSRDVLLDRVWGVEYPGGTRTVDVHVAQLRRKLRRPSLIRTLRGAGYKAVAP